MSSSLKVNSFLWMIAPISSSKTQGQIVGARESLNRRGNMAHVFGPNQKAERRRPFGTGLVRHCLQGLFSPFFSFLRAIFCRPFRLCLAPTICPWVSEDAPISVKVYSILSVQNKNKAFAQCYNIQSSSRVEENRKRISYSKRSFIRVT